MKSEQYNQLREKNVKQNFSSGMENIFSAMDMHCASYHSAFSVLPTLKKNIKMYLSGRKEKKNFKSS